MAASSNNFANSSFKSSAVSIVSESKTMQIENVKIHYNNLYLTQMMKINFK